MTSYEPTTEGLGTVLVELLPDYLDGALPPDAHADLEPHLPACEDGSG